ncbi:MAG TPA: cysteine desulfurase [Thermopetrobacter sp.]|nr:cysteine desulfurase [Thermopetrobacter sp.]
MNTDMRAYLDWNATAPLSEAAAEAMRAAHAAGALNPSARHRYGQKGRAIVEEARREMAAALGCRPEEIVFTSGGTEADNLAVRGAPVAATLVSFMEHPAVMRPARACGRPLRLLEVDGNGVVDLAALERHLAEMETPALVCVMLASNESGVVQPLAEVVRIARRHGAAVFCDAVQAVGRMAVDFADLGVDMMALSAHKFGGPQGVGALIVREGFALTPLILGGGQERGRRSGTENVAGIAGMAAALAEAVARLPAVTARMATLRARLEAGLREISPEVTIFSAAAPRLCNTTFFAHPRIDAEVALMSLDLDGVAISAGSACHAGHGEVSRALIAMGVPRDLARWALRASLGPTTEEAEIDAFLAAWRRLLSRRARTAA